MIAALRTSRRRDAAAHAEWFNSPSLVADRPFPDIEAKARIVIAMQSSLWYTAINDSIQGDGYGYQSCGSKC
jgi:hypothetical protein